MSKNRMRIELRQPHVAVPGRPLPDQRLSLVLEEGHRTVVVGRSGSGKTLLSRLVLGRKPAAPLLTTGSASVAAPALELALELDLSRDTGTSIPELRALRGTALGYVPQGGRENLVPGWSVAEHQDRLGRGRPGFAERVQAYMERLGVPPTAANLAATATGLSEGMIRRVLLALSLAHEPKILILDEPTTGLDEHAKHALLELLAEQLKERESGLLVNTHDYRVARTLGQTWMMVEHGSFVSSTTALEEAEGRWTAFVDAGKQVEAIA